MENFGEMKPDGTYPEGTVNALVNEKLHENNRSSQAVVFISFAYAHM